MPASNIIIQESLTNTGNENISGLTALTEVSDAALPVLFNQYVFALQVSVGDGRFALGAKDLHVEMRQPAGDGESHAEAAGSIQSAELEVVVQGAHLLEVSDQPQLGAGVPGGHVRSYEA